MPHQIRTYVDDIIQLSRPANLLLPLIQVGAGYLLASDTAWQYAPPELYAILLCLILIHSAFTIMNDVIDRGIDIDNQVHTAITSKDRLYRKHLLLIALGMLIVSGVCLLFVSSNALWLILILVLLCLAYNLPPLRFSMRPIASILTLGTAYGIIPFLLGVVAAGGTVSWRILLIALCWALVRMGISILKDFKDKVGDKKHNKRTFLLVFGERTTRRASFLLSVVGFIGLIYSLYPFITDSLHIPYLIISLITIGIFFKERRGIISTTTPKLSFERFLRMQPLYDIYLVLWMVL